MSTLIASKMAYIQRIWDLRHFWLLLVRFDLRNRYKGSFLGVGWSLVKPLGMTAVLCVVFGKLFGESAADYAPFLLVGMTIWQYLGEVTISGCFSFSVSRSFALQRPIPLLALPLRTVLGAMFHVLMAFSLTLAITIVARGVPAFWPLLSLIPAFVLLFLFGWFVATLMAMASAHFPDTRHAAEMALQALFYLTPVMYRPAMLKEQGRDRLLEMISLNPLTSLLELFRDPVLDGAVPSAHHYLVTTGMVAGLGALVWIGLRRLERNMVFWI